MKRETTPVHSKDSDAFNSLSFFSSECSTTEVKTCGKLVVMFFTIDTPANRKMRLKISFPSSMFRHPVKMVSCIALTIAFRIAHRASQSWLCGEIRENDLLSGASSGPNVRLKSSPSRRGILSSRSFVVRGILKYKTSPLSEGVLKIGA